MISIADKSQLTESWRTSLQAHRVKSYNQQARYTKLIDF